MWLFLLCLTIVFGQTPLPHDRTDRPGGQTGGGRGQADPLRRTNRTRCFSKDDFKFPARVPDWAQGLMRGFLSSVPDICTTFKFNLCTANPELHLNITVGGETRVNQDITQESEWCYNADTSLGGCTPCIGIKKGSLSIKPNFAQVCPEYRLKCSIGGFEQTLTPEDSFKFPCYSFGQNCTAATQKQCLKQRGCGWCNGGGTGREMDDDTGSAEGQGCTPMIPKRTRGQRRTNKRPTFIPFCSDCPAENFITIAVKDEPAKGGAAISVHYVIGFTLGSAISVLACVGCFVFFIRGKTRQERIAQGYSDTLAGNDSLSESVPMSTGEDGNNAIQNT